MKALLSITPGDTKSLILKDIDIPGYKSNQILLKIKSCGVNFPDSLIIEDKYQFRPPRPFSPGGEVAGEVVEVGSDVKDWKVGDRVIALCRWGGMAEYVACDESSCIEIPYGMTDNEAAAFIFTYGTSLHALKDRAKLKKNETLLVLGAAGGVGLAAVELGKAMGAKVIACASSDEKIEIAKSKGADEGLVYPKGPFNKVQKRELATLFKSITGKNGANVIYDAIGGDYAEAALRCISWEGRFLVVGFPAGIPKIPLNLPLLKGCQIMGVFWGTFAERNPETDKENNLLLARYFNEKLIKPLVSKTFKLENGASGIRELAERKAIGKIVITV